MQMVRTSETHRPPLESRRVVSHYFFRQPEHLDCFRRPLSLTWDKTWRSTKFSHTVGWSFSICDDQDVHYGGRSACVGSVLSRLDAGSLGSAAGYDAQRGH